MWNVDGYGAGTVTLAGDRLLILRENGELVVAPASPEGFHPMQHASILSKVVRAYPALADGRLYARDKDLGVLKAVITLSRVADKIVDAARLQARATTEEISDALR
jgi:hypothetical protein